MASGAIFSAARSLCSVLILEIPQITLICGLNPPDSGVQQDASRDKKIYNSLEMSWIVAASETAESLAYQQRAVIEQRLKEIL